jgi:hypothetical protein
MNNLIASLLRSLKRVPDPVWLLLLGILAYGLLIPKLGFYLDDWYIVLFYKYFGAGNFSEFFLGDRPLFGIIYDVFVPIFRDSRIGWQIFVLLTHVLASTVFWQFLEILFPNRRRFNLMAAIFFLVYPGFKFHWFSVMYSQVFFLYAVYFLSFVLMIKAVSSQKAKFWFVAGALLCQVIGIVPQESFLGLEFTRPVILYFAVRKCEDNHRWKRLPLTLIRWIPYLFVFLGFTLYRILSSANYSYQVSMLDLLKQDFIETFSDLVTKVILGTAQGVVSAWTSTVNVLDGNLISSRSALLVLLIVIGGGLGLFLLKQKDNGDKVASFYGNAILLGLFAAVAALAPFLMGGFEAKLDFPNNRYLIAVAPGAAVFAAGLVEYFLRTENQKNIIAAIMTGFAVTSQLVTARGFELNWKYQAEFFQQLYWRAPAIVENTLLVSEDLPFSRYSSATSLTAPLNLLYNPESTAKEISYAMVLLTQQVDVVTDFTPGTLIDYELRSFVFSGSTDRMLLFTKPSTGCLRILTREDTADEVYSTYRANIWHEALERANTDAIILGNGQSGFSLERYYGEENPDHWCYYYEKADLARQQKDWDGVVGWFEEGFAKNYTPYNQFEWLPLLEAYIRTDNMDQVVETVNHIYDFNYEANDAFCKLWTTIGNGSGNNEIIQELNRLTQCGNDQ